MDDDNLEVPPFSINRKNPSINLPINMEALKEFVASLLGKAESVEGYIESAFEIDFAGFEQLNYIIDDRITKQNQSVLIEFRAKLFFNDNSLLSFSGIRNFQEYKERRNVICTGFTFTWIYLVEFHDKKVPEKQEISILSVEQIPRISYSIRCTNQGWGIEIAELIRNCIKGFVNVNFPLANFRRKAMENPLVIGIPFFILSYLLCFIFVFPFIYSEEGLANCLSFSDQIGQFIGENILLGEKVDFLIKFFNTCQAIDSKKELIFFLVALFSFVPSIFSTQLIIKLIKLPTYRFLLFTEESKKEREKYFTRISWWKNFWLITVGVGSILAFLNRLLGNYLLEWLGNVG
ncbi:hypothetical protein ACP6PL_28010 [Dapis sp. BLCC M126]|uniref:hypothetical protein n=1 Tax=Dapis sp. BLCC M126 TaxID=3400189 RepID=UPI003CEAC8D0